MRDVYLAPLLPRTGVLSADALLVENILAEYLPPSYSLNRAPAGSRSPCPPSHRAVRGAAARGTAEIQTNGIRG